MGLEIELRLGIGLVIGFRVCIGLARLLRFRFGV